MSDSVKNKLAGMGVIIAGIIMIVIILFTVGWGWAHFRLWRAEYSGRALEIEKEYKGKAILAEAEHARKSRVMAAQAEKDAAELTAQAIAIVGQAAKDFPEYRQQEFFLALGEALQAGNIDQILYIPTEANMPITEAGKRPHIPQE